MSDARTLEIYNQKAGEYAQRFAKSKPDRALQSFIDAMPPKGRVLDFGCGPGHCAAMIRDAGLIVDAWDASDQMVAMAKTMYDIDAQLGTFDQLDAVDRYDGIWANFSLLHAPLADMPANLSRIHTALTSGGLLHLGLKIGDGENRDALGRRYAYFQPEALTQLLITAGFTPASFHQGEEPGLSGEIAPYMLVTAHA